jgi:hypothetical protein
MYQRFCFLATAFSFGFWGPSTVWGQLTVLDQTRSLTAAIQDAYSQNAVLASDTDIMAGSYNNSITGGEKFTNHPAPNSLTGTPSQTSSVSSAGFSEQAAVSSDVIDANIYGSFEGFIGEFFVDSQFSIDFSVGAPTPFSVTEQDSLIAPATEHDYQFATASLALTQSGSPTSLFVTGFVNQSCAYNLPPGFDESDGPTTFSTVLTPGIIYTLKTDLNTEQSIDGFDGGLTNSLSFTTSVPEPASFAVMALMAAIGRSRRRRVLRPGIR